MDEVQRSEAALRGRIQGLTGPQLFPGEAKRLGEILADLPAEGIQIRLHTDPPNDVPEGATWAWGPAEAEEITHWSMWDAPSDRPRRVVGRPLRWLGELLVRLGTRRAKLIGTWERGNG